MEVLSGAQKAAQLARRIYEHDACPRAVDGGACRVEEGCKLSEARAHLLGLAALAPRFGREERWICYHQVSALAQFLWQAIAEVAATEFGVQLRPARVLGSEGE